MYCGSHWQRRNKGHRFIGGDDSRPPISCLSRPFAALGPAGSGKPKGTHDYTCVFVCTPARCMLYLCKGFGMYMYVCVCFVCACICVLVFARDMCVCVCGLSMCVCVSTCVRMYVRVHVRLVYVDVFPVCICILAFVCVCACVLCLGGDVGTCRASLLGCPHNLSHVGRMHICYVHSCMCVRVHMFMCVSMFTYGCTHFYVRLWLFTFFMVSYIPYTFLCTCVHVYV